MSRLPRWNWIVCQALIACAMLASCQLAHAVITITPNAGYSILWNGNDGANFSAANPAVVPNNLARATMGSTPFADGELAVGPHFIPKLNDGLYGNQSSWISSGPAGPPNFAGVTMSSQPLVLVSSVAFGRDNGNNVADDCGGQCGDRSLGSYTLYRTTIAGANASTAVTGNAATGWEAMGVLNYVSNDDAIVGGAFTSYFRHEFQVLLNGLPVPATAIRIDVPGGGIGGEGTAIDEIEIYGVATPEPATFVLWSVMGAIGLGIACWQRRRTK